VIEVELECAELGIDLDQALSIRRKQLVMGKALKGGASKLKDQCMIKQIRKEFEQRQRSLLDISQAYDGYHLPSDTGAVSAQCLSAIHMY
jgi:hypothetical protein